MDAINLVPIPGHLFRTAGLLDPLQMRTLYALHLAAALELGDDLHGLVTYDAGMADAARRHAAYPIAPRGMRQLASTGRAKWRIAGMPAKPA